MKKIYLLLFIILGFPVLAQDYWEQRDSVNGPAKAVCGSFVILERGFVVGGLDDFGFKRKMYSYNMFQDDWDDEESIGGISGDGLQRGSACSFAIGTKGYVCLGQSETVPYLDDMWEYDRESGAWTQKANFAGGARKQAVSFVIEGIAYVGTGQALTGLKKDLYKYDPTINAWTQLNDFPSTARRQAVGFAMGAYGFVGTGDDGVLKKDFWMYTPSSDSWIQKTDFPGTARAGATGWATFPTCFIATGEDINFEYRKDVWEYNYYGNSWVQRADFPGPGRKNAISFVVNGVAFLGTGYSGVFEDDFFAYFGIVGLGEHKQQFSTVVYPNPVHELATIEIEHLQVSDLELRLFSLTGQELTGEIIISKFEGKLQFNASYLTPGNYFYKLKETTTGKTSSGKLVKI
jgi:hypothetical protein